MPNIAVQKHNEETSLPEQCLAELRKFSDEIRGKAFDLFEKYGRPAGRDLEHWLKAEKQLLSMPRSELLETEAGFDLRIAVPGFDAKEIEGKLRSEGTVAIPEKYPLVIAGNKQVHLAIAIEVCGPDMNS